MVTETSKLVFHNEVLPKLASSQAKVLQTIVDRGLTNFNNRQLAYIMGYEINQITPRTKELVEMGVLEIVMDGDKPKKVPDIRSGRLCQIMNLKGQSGQMNLI